MPKLLGTIKLPFPLRHKLPREAGYQEQIQTVGIDGDGQGWGLVERMTPIPVHPDDSPLLRAEAMKASRINLVRWVRFEAIPDAPDEVATAAEWK